MIIVYKTRNEGAYHIEADDDLEELLSAYKWRVNPAMKAGKPILRVVGTHQISKKIVTLQRLILNEFDRKKVILQYEEGLNFRRKNLYIITTSDNQARKKKSKRSTSQYFGVHKKSNVFIASITRGGKTTYLGCSADEEEAARIYDMGAKKLHGKSAQLNF